MHRLSLRCLGAREIVSHSVLRPSPRRLSPDMIDYYKTNARKLTFGEFQRMGNPVDAVAAWVGARFNLPVMNSVGSPNILDISGFETDFSKLSAEANRAIIPFIEQLHRLGFHTERYFRIPVLRRDYISVVVTLPHETGQEIAALYYSYNPMG